MMWALPKSSFQLSRETNMQNRCNPSLIRVLLADDHPVVISALESVFKKKREFEIVGAAVSGEELLKILARDNVDMVITDFFMPRTELGGSREDGFSMLRGIRHSYPKIFLIVFTITTSGAVLSRIKELGVHGIVGKDESEAVLIDMCKNLSQMGTETLLSPFMRERISVLDEGGERSLSKLSGLELEVLQMYASGMALTDIAKKLNRALTTVATHKNSAMRKLNIDCNADIIKYAYDSGLV
jgi:two-component system capsular synthesis response regulator RcsB